MESKKISTDSSVFIFNELETYKTNVFLIERKAKVFLIDTFCGTDSMNLIKGILSKNLIKKLSL
ncbi:hypothetical protein [Clostridium pasteurianum]|uniref:hypothetical protein n=1 Tax=Clostridium pasteurianum TaxID=1501 RepID=UPI001FA939CC|nr:hypothetical protein [Clostridium pasteurianum]